MMKLRSLGAVIGLMGIAGVANAQKMVVGYITNWGDPAKVMQSTDLSKVTHLDVAFENPTDDDGNLSYNSNDDMILSAAHMKGVKVLVSIGGGSVSEDKAMTKRYFDLQSDAKRAGFVAKLAAYVTAHNFDGLDVDLEGPSIGKDYGAFVHDLSAALIPNGKLLTAAASQGYGGDQIPSSTFDQFSFVNIMAYDNTGPWNKDRPGPHSTFDQATSQVDYWVKRGLAKSKIVLGVPFYGYGFGTAYRSGDYSYSELVGSFPGAESVDQIGSTIYYNGMPTIKAKAKYVVDQGLGGIMIWHIGADLPGPKSLLGSIWDGLHPTG